VGRYSASSWSLVSSTADLFEAAPSPKGQKGHLMIYTNEHQIQAWRSDLSAHQEAWKPDHDLAMQCYGCEEFVALGLSLLGFLKASYARWQDQVFRGTVPFDANVDDANLRAFELWVMTAQLIIVDVDRLERECFQVERAQELRVILPEVQLALRNWTPSGLSANVAFRDYVVSDLDFADVQKLKQAKSSRPYTPKKRSVSKRSPDA
jgi:hypothetical protein